MKYFNLETITGDIIMIKTNRSTPPACPVLAQSVPTVPPIDSMLVRFILWMCSFFGPAIRAICTTILAEGSRIATFTARFRCAYCTITFIAGLVVVEIVGNLTAHCIEKMVGA